jgi:selenide,water dikinase
MALSILAWPTEKLAPAIAAEVLRGAQEVCDDAGIPLAGGHSIDAPEPVFGLSVNGLVADTQLRTNGGGKPGDLLYVTKPLGVGILATALKKEKISTPDLFRLLDITTQLNSIGMLFGEMPMVHALTDVTGFGLLGHLLEVCAASGTGAQLNLASIPLLPGLQVYLDQFLLPDQVYRNWNAYGAHVQGVTGAEFMYLCDPQTSGGLLVSIDQHAAHSFEQRMQIAGQDVWQIGRLIPGAGIQVL